MGIFRITASQKMAQKPPTRASYPVAPGRHRSGPGRARPLAHDIVLQDDPEFARAADAEVVGRA